MKLYLFLFLSFASVIGISQDTINQQDTVLQIDTTQKVIVVNPLPISIYNVLKTKGTGIECTMYSSSKTFTLPKNNGTNYFLSFIEGKATVNFNKTNTAYVMILVDDDFYMDAEVSISEKSSYIVFKKDGVKYYNVLSSAGKKFFKKFL